MSELTITAIRLGLLALLWVFIFSIVSVLRSDLYGTRVVTRGAAPGSRAPDVRGRPSRAIRKGPTHLSVVEGAMRGTTVPLAENGVLIGRNPECTLVLTDDYASGRHLRLYPGNDGWYADDLGSTNGTFVGERRVGTGFKIEPGAQIRIGRTILELRS